MHAALALAVSGDPVGLATLRATSLAHADPVFRDVVASVCQALQAVVERRCGEAARVLEATLPRATALGGSAAQREVLEDTLVYALAESGRTERAAEVLDRRLGRRASPLDARRRAALATRARQLTRQVSAAPGAPWPGSGSAAAWARSSTGSRRSCCRRRG